MCMNSCHPHDNLRKGYYYTPHFTDEETGVLSSEVAAPKSHTWCMVELRCEPALLPAEMEFLTTCKIE